MAGPNFDEPDLGLEAGARGSELDDVPMFRRTVWPRCRFLRSRRDAPHRAGASKTPHRSLHLHRYAEDDATPSLERTSRLIDPQFGHERPI